MEEEKIVEEEQKPHFSFPWGAAITIAVLMVLVITCLVVLLVLGPQEEVTSSSQIAVSSL